MIEIHLLTRQSQHIGSDEVEHVPNVGDRITYEKVWYKVKTVTWKDLTGDPTVEIRVEVLDDGT